MAPISHGIFGNKPEGVPADVDDMVRSCSNTRGNRVFKRCLFFCFFVVVVVVFLSEIYFGGTKAVSYFTGDNFCFVIIKKPL